MEHLDKVINAFRSVSSATEFYALFELHNPLLAQFMTPSVMQWLSFDVAAPENRASWHIINEIIDAGSISGKNDKTKLNEIDKCILISLRAGAGRDEREKGPALDPAIIRDRQPFRLSPYL